MAESEAEAGAGFRIISPILMQAISSGVHVPVELRLETAQALQSSECIASAVLRIKEQVVLKAADENHVIVAFKVEAFGAVHEMTEALAAGDAAAIVRNHPAFVRAAGKIVDGFSRFKPSVNTAPGGGCGADCEDEGAFGQILRINVPGSGSEAPLQIAIESNGEIGANGKVAESQLGFHLPVAEDIVPAGGKERIDPDSGAKERELRYEIMVGFLGFIGNGGVGALAREFEPFDGVGVIMQHVVDPAELEHHGEIDGVVFVSDGQVFEGVLEVTRLHALFAEQLGLLRGLLR